ncbi:C39 family peptidase [Candidatus Dojkabacteria bacterium]|nr:C39 family peptidase [Candidatus Dojkabacteria bacterium]
MKLRSKVILLVTSYIVLITCVVSFFIYSETLRNKLNLSNRAVDEISDTNIQLSSEVSSCTNQVTSLSESLSEATKIPISTQILLDIPLYAQKHRASCEFASTHSAMLYFGVDISEEEIIAAVGTDTVSARYFDTDGNLHWSNPQEQFVGNIDVPVVYVDGYGVYNEPIYEYLVANGFSKSVSKTGWDFTELSNYILHGYPAIAWTSNDYKTKEVGTMISEDGIENPWIWGEHAVLLRGVDENNVYIMNVGTGIYQTITIDTFLTGFANLNNMAVVVIKD